MRRRLVLCGPALALATAALLMWLPGALFASPGDAYADKVANVTGTFGHCCDAGNLSSNPLVAAPLVLGAPDASPTQTANFIQISDGSSIILVFVDNVALANGSMTAADLRIHTYDEPWPSAAKIEVSADGVTFETLPAPPLNDPVRYCAGPATPASFCNYDDNPAGYIDLDFDSVGLSYVTHVRLTDLTAEIDGETTYPTLGFDLDAVEALRPGPETCLTPPPGLVSWWPGDDTAVDIEDGNDGTQQNGIAFTDGVVGRAFRLDGVNDFIQVPQATNLEPASVTVDAWVRSMAPGSIRYIVSKGGKACAVASYGLYTENLGLAFYVSDGTAYKDSPYAPPSIWDGLWHHVAGTFDQTTRTVRLFVDGAEVGAGTTTTFDIAYNLPDTDDLFIGRFGGSCPLNFPGDVDEVEVFARALSAAEIQALYLRGSAGKCKGCTHTLGFWKNHANDWPVSGLQLGTVTYSAADLLRILNQPVKGNGLVSLAHQLIAAKLNVATGASGPTSTIADADALIGSLVVPPVGTGWVAPSVTGPLTSILDQYNKGFLGPPHCDE